MGYLDNLKSLISPQTAGKISGPKNTNDGQSAKHTESTKQAQKPEARFTVDSSELEIRAEMNKALGFVKSTQNLQTDYAKIDAEFAKDPLAFAQKYASKEVRENAAAATTDFDAVATVSRTLSPERQEQVVAGFSQRNDSPRAFTSEFLDLFSVA